MVDHPENSDLHWLGQCALEQLAKLHKLNNLLLVDQAEATHPDTHVRVFKFTAIACDDANGLSYEMIVDARGKPQESPDLESLFIPSTAFHSIRVPRLAAAVRIQPTSNVLTLNPGDHFDEKVIVTIPKNAVVPRADVYFLADTTASMGGILGAVQAGINNILTALSGVGVDVAFGVGNYRDFPNDAYAFQHQLALTTVTAPVAAAIANWSPVGGGGGDGDGPEGQLFALNSLAEPPGGTIGWRAGAKRIIVWFGDVPSHDPICPAISRAPTPITETTVAGKLTGENISVIAISTSTPGPDADPMVGATEYIPDCGPPGGTPGQASNIAAATGGSFVTGIQPSNIIANITNLLTSAVGSINNVNLLPTGAFMGFISSISPAVGYGPLDKDKKYTLPFDVKFTGNVPCKDRDQVFEGRLEIVVDGVEIGAKPVRITVPACKDKFVYSVKFVCGIQEIGCKQCSPVTAGRYATEINIHNFSAQEVKVVKRVIPVVLADAPAGREPAIARARGEDTIVLPPHTATMDDCCRLSELLFGAQQTETLNIGFLEITASDEVAVTVLYTSSDLDLGGLSIDVQQIKSSRH